MNTKLGAFIIAALMIWAIIKTIKTFKKGKLTTRLLFMWTGIWFAIGFFALFPHYLDYIMKYLNFGNRLFFITTGAILLLFIIIFYLSANIARLNQKVSRLAQEVALLKNKMEGNGNIREPEELNELNETK